MGPHRVVSIGLACVAVIPLVAGAAPAQIGGSPDVPLELSGVLVRPGEVVDDIESIAPMPLDLGPLPEGTQVTAVSFVPTIGAIFAVGHSVALPGGVTMRPRDLVAWNGASYSIALDGAGNGIPDGVGIDAIDVSPVSSGLWISFDSTFELGGFLYREADVIGGPFGVAFDSVAAGLPAGLDVDGFALVAGSAELLLSFDVGGVLGGVTFADEDVLRYDPVADVWLLEVDGSSRSPSWEGGDLDAIALVPEPGSPPTVVASTILLVTIGRRRAQRLRAAARVDRKGRG